MGMVSIKMYDKFGHILRIETTVKDVTQFRHYRGVEQRDGSVGGLEKLFRVSRKTTEAGRSYRGINFLTPRT